MPGTHTTGGDIDERQRADIAGQVACGALSIQDACTRYQLSRECVVEWLAAFRHSSLTAFDEQLRRTLAEQGVDVGALATAEFQGDLAELTISDLIQTLTLGRREGVIAVCHDGRESRIWCAGGEIVDAESGKLAGAAAVYRMLALEHGRIRASFTRVKRPHKLNVSTMELLLDGARRSDEAQSIRRRLGSGLYRLAAKALSVGDSLTEQEYAVLRQFDVPVSVPEVLVESELGDLETLTLLSQLVAREYLLPDGEASPSSAALRPSQALSRPPIVLSLANTVAPRGPRRWRMGAVLGLGALGFASWLVPRHLAGSPERRPASSPVPSAAAAQQQVDPVEPRLPEPSSTTGTALARAVAQVDSPKPARVTPAAGRRAPRSSVASPAPLLERSPRSQAEAAEITSAAPRMQIIEAHAPKLRILE